MTNDVQTLISKATGLLKSLIAIPSLSRGEEQATDFLQNYIGMQGVVTRKEGNNIRCLSPMFDLRKPTLPLNSHTDAVKSVNEWREAPFSAVEENNKIHGLGSNDAGASVVGPLQVFLQFCRTTRAYNLVFLASCEGEVSGRGGIESVLPQLSPVQFAIVGEPTETQPVITERGLVVLGVTAYKRSEHAARDRGDDTVCKVLNDIAWFRDYRFPRGSPFLGSVKVSVTMANAEAQYNTIPNHCTFVVDIRSNEYHTNQELFNEIWKHISCEAKARSFRLGSSHISPDHPLVRKTVALGRVPFDSPALSDQAPMPSPPMKMGSGKDSHSHTTDELIFVEEMEEAIALYLELLDGTEI